MAHLTKVASLAASIIQQMPQVGRWQAKFLLHLFVLWLSIRGRHNFTHLARYSGRPESTYRQHFRRPFVDFLAFNIKLAGRVLGPRKALAFDPRYLPKRGKHTEGGGKFWSGVAGQVKPGLEIGGLAVVDLDRKTALQLLASQTIVGADDGLSLLDRYAASIVANRDQLLAVATLAVATHVVVDAYFAKKPFINRLCEAGFEVTTRLRKDARLRYLYRGKQERRPGRRKQYAGRVDGCVATRPGSLHAVRCRRAAQVGGLSRRGERASLEAQGASGLGSSTG